MTIPKFLRQQINMHCHHEAQAYAHKLRSGLLLQASVLLKQGYTVEQVAKRILVPCSNNNAPVKSELPE